MRVRMIGGERDGETVEVQLDGAPTVAALAPYCPPEYRPVVFGARGPYGAASQGVAIAHIDMELCQVIGSLLAEYRSGREGHYRMQTVFKDESKADRIELFDSEAEAMVATDAALADPGVERVTVWPVGAILTIANGPFRGRQYRVGTHGLTRVGPDGKAFGRG